MNGASRGCALALDHGTKRVGFAVVDPLGIAVNPLEAWADDGGGETSLFRYVAKLLDERTVGVFVIGLPLGTAGEENPRSLEVREFARRLGARFPGVAIEFQDERLSTKEALELAKEAGKFGAERRRWKDSLSALVVLRDWLERSNPG